MGGGFGGFGGADGSTVGGTGLGCTERANKCSGAGVSRLPGRLVSVARHSTWFNELPAGSLVSRFFGFNPFQTAGILIRLVICEIFPRDVQVDWLAKGWQSMPKCKLNHQCTRKNRMNKRANELQSS